MQIAINNTMTIAALDDCDDFMSSFIDQGATIADKKKYAQCIEETYSTPDTAIDSAAIEWSMAAFVCVFIILVLKRHDWVDATMGSMMSAFAFLCMATIFGFELPSIYDFLLNVG
jgi:hypothetical protein